MPDRDPLEYLDEILDQPFDRRSFFKLIAGAGMSAAALGGMAGAASAQNGAYSKLSRLNEFRVVVPSNQDILQVPEGFAADLVISWDDEFDRGMRYGFNNDWVGFYRMEDGVPLDLMRPQGPYGDRTRKPVTEGLLYVNHEYVSPFFVSGWTRGTPKTAEQVAKEQYAVGGSVMHVKRGQGGVWRVVDNSKYSRRLTGNAPMFRLTGPAAAAVKRAEVPGTIGNCSGGSTPWGTVLSCEENVQDYGTGPPTEFAYSWGGDYSGDNLLGYGWTIEVDPLDPESVPVKHTALGRFRHENVAIAFTRDGRVVAYQGDDVRGGALYKFISSRSWRPTDREFNKQLLSEGQLFIALFEPDGYPSTQGVGRWTAVPMTPEVLLDTFAWGAANLPIAQHQLNRPEDVEVNPNRPGEIWIALTNNSNARPPDVHGRIRRLIEKDGDFAATEFSWLDFAAGGDKPGFSSPDNLQFDTNGELWMVTDISSASLNSSSAVRFHGNNGVFFIALRGSNKGAIYRFANMPRDSEGTGPYFVPDGKSFFLSVQHPGEETPNRGGVLGDPNTYTSWWPGGSRTTFGSTPSTPKPSLVSVRRLDGR